MLTPAKTNKQTLSEMMRKNEQTAGERVQPTRAVAPHCTKLQGFCRNFTPTSTSRLDNPATGIPPFFKVFQGISKHFKGFQTKKTRGHCLGTSPSPPRQEWGPRRGYSRCSVSPRRW